MAFLLSAFSSIMAATTLIKCSVCKGLRVCCPGCSGFTEKYPKLFMGCGVFIRCPKCVGRKYASEDKTIMQMFYHSMEDSICKKIIAAYYEKMRIDLQTRFPDESFDDLSA